MKNIQEVPFYLKQDQRKQKDFCEIVFGLLLKTFKKCKLFKIQKAIKKLKISKDQNKQEEKLEMLKKLTLNQIKLMSAYCCKCEFKIQIQDKPKVFGDTTNINELPPNLMKLYQEFRELNPFKTSQLEIEKILQKVDKKKGKSKDIRETKKLKKQIKIVEKKNDEESIKKIEIEKLQAQLNINKKPVSKRVKEFQDKQKNPKIPSKKFIKEDNLVQKKIKKQDAKFIDPKFVNKLHPSLQASLENKQKVFGAFKGTKIKL